MKLGTSSFGMKNSTLSKKGENDTHLMQSSLRGILFAPPDEVSRRQTTDSLGQSRMSMLSGSTSNYVSSNY